MLVPGEDEAALMELSEHLKDELQPVGELEGLLVERVIAAAWRLRRLGRVKPVSSPGSALRSWPRGLSMRPAVTSHNHFMLTLSRT
jgi:hypothetical protein